MGGGSSRSDSQQNTTTETNNASLQDTSGFAAGSVKATNIEVLDGGAIQSSFEFAKESQAHFGETFESVLGIVEKSIDAQGDIVDGFSEKNASEESAGFSSVYKNLPTLMVIGVAGFVAYKVLK